MDREPTKIEVLWANFEKAVAIADGATSRQILTDLAWAKEQGLPAAFVRVADEVRRYLESFATTATNASDIISAPPGSLFKYVGRAHGRGFGSATPPASGLGRILIKGESGGADVYGEARLSHGLVSSVGNLSDIGFEKYVLALKLQESARFAPLLIGVAVLNLFGGDTAGPARYRAAPWVSPSVAGDNIIDVFKRAVETGSLWRLLETSPDRDSAPSEATLQVLFEFLSNALSREFDISVDPQANHGAGAVDICISRGASEACCIELKLASHGKLVRGFTRQLPAYMISRGTTHGRYVVVCQSDGPHRRRRSRNSSRLSSPRSIADSMSLASSSMRERDRRRHDGRAGPCQ